MYRRFQILVLKNMVEREELEDDSEFADIKEDVKDECSQHGRVRLVLLPRAKDGFPYAVEGSIFVEFEAAEGARAAAMALRGRKFADKTVALSYVSVGFAKLDVFDFNMCSYLLSVRRD